MSHHFTLDTFVTRGVLPILGIALFAALVLNTIISLIAVENGVSPDFHPLTPLFYSIFTVLGLLAGWVGWRGVQELSSHPKKLLTILVPVLTILSFIPDTSILLFPIIPDTTLSGVLGLMLMHFVVVGCGVPAYIFASRHFKAN